MIKNALIIGGTGGIGSAIVNMLIKRKVAVYATSLKLGKTESKIIPKECKFFKCDLTNKKEVEKLANFFVSKNIKIDLVVNCVTGKLNLKLFENLSLAEIKNDIDIILMGSINLYHFIVPILKNNRSGTIVNIISSSIFDPVPNRMSSYITAKSGLFGLTKSLQAELAPFGVKVFSLSPNFVETKLLNAFPKKMLEFERMKMPENKFLLPEDIAKVIQLIIDGQINTKDNILIHSKNDIANYIYD